MSAFQREILVRFGHCDAAGWVFYPRYFEMISDFVEDWFEDGLEASAPGLFHHKQILTPSVHFTVDFEKPTRYGDRATARATAIPPELVSRMHRFAVQVEQSPPKRRRSRIRALSGRTAFK